MNSFDDKIKRMRRIFRGLESYGEGTPAEQATRFRFTELMDPTIDRAKAKGVQGAQPSRPVDFLISLSGFSPATTILACEILRPRRLLVISSELTLDSIDTIAEHLVGKGKLRHQDFKHSSCTPTDPLGIYQIVREELARLAPFGAERPYTVIDITGGKKVMSATAALAAWQLDLPLCYIDSDFDPELRQPLPGSERLLFLNNPTTLFGDSEMEHALHLFRSGAYEAAQSRYGELSNHISQPGKARFLRDLSALYRAWCDLDLAGLPACIDAVEHRLGDPLSQVPEETALRIRQQLGFLRSLRPDNHQPILLSYYLLGLHYLEVLRRHDFAALLFYRTIEGCLQRRLEMKYPGFQCHDPDYTRIDPDKDSLLQRYNKAAALIGPEHQEAQLPRRLGYMNSAGLLFALEDNLLRRAEIKTRKALQHLYKLSEIRNRSVLAHGFQSVAAEDSKKLQAQARSLLRAFWSLHGTGGDIDELCAGLLFLRNDL